MTLIILTASLWYLCVGAIYTLNVSSDVQLRGRVVGALIWPWLMRIDGTPRIRPFLRWARGEIVIEASEWPPGTERLTIQRRDGSEYAETVAPTRSMVGDARDGGAT